MKNKDLQILIRMSRDEEDFRKRFYYVDYWHDGATTIKMFRTKKELTKWKNQKINPQELIYKEVFFWKGKCYGSCSLATQEKIKRGFYENN